jgi:hypothetical protein
MDRHGGVSVILGRTPEGLIKIKKDDPLDLRAVNCACCNTCPCVPPAGRWRIEAGSFTSPVYPNLQLTITERSDYNEYDPCGFFYAYTAEGFDLIIYWDCEQGGFWGGYSNIPAEYYVSLCGNNQMSGNTTAEQFYIDPSIGLLTAFDYCDGVIIASKEP